MMLTELHRIPDAALPLEPCKVHLRLGSGFADDGGQDALVLRHLRAAIAAVEGRIGKVLIAREFRLTLPDWRDPRGEALPVAPVLAVASVVLRGPDGTAQPVDPARWRLEADTHRPRLRPTGWLLPHPPSGGGVEVTFTAGFGADWQAVPPDLAQAVMMLVAQYHESRHGNTTGPAMPFGVAALIERWRVVRTSAGGAGR